MLVSVPMAVNITSSTAMAPMTSFARRESVGTDTGGRMATSGLLQLQGGRGPRAVAGGREPRARAPSPRGVRTESPQDNAPNRSWFPAHPAMAHSFSHPRGASAGGRGPAGLDVGERGQRAVRGGYRAPGHPRVG